MKKVTSSETPSGVEPSVFMVTNANVKDGVPEISSLVEHQAESLRKIGWAVHVGIIDDRTSLRGISRNASELKTELARVRPLLVHAQYGSVTAAVARMIQGSLPLIVSFCGDDLLGTPNPGLMWRVRERLARGIGLFSAGAAAAIIVKSRNLLQALPIGLQSRAIVLPNGVDTQFFQPMDQEACRAQLGWSPQSKVVLFNASQQDNQTCKNADLARAAVDIVAATVPQVSLHRLSKARREDVRLCMNASDCLLVTSLHEGSPNIVKEAMACNLPIVSVPCGDVPERLRMTWPGGICAYIPGALAEGIHEVFKIGSRSNGRKQILAQGLAAESVADRLSEVYRTVASGGVFRSACVE